MLGSKSLPFLEVVVFVVHSFGALRIEPLTEIFFYQACKKRE